MTINPKIIQYNPSTTEPVIGESITINKTIPSKQFKEISNPTIEKVTPEQFISGIKNYIQILEYKNKELKEILKANEYTIKQLKLILNSSVLEEISD